MKALWTILFLLLSLDSLLRFLLLLLRVVAPRRANADGIKNPGRATLLIAARDEAGSIGQTIRGLLPQLSEWDGARIFIVADNCADETEREAIAAGALVSVREGGLLGKGPAIEWWIRTHRHEWSPQDVIVILDADSRLEPGSLAALRATFAAGTDAAQAFVAPDAAIVSSRLAGYSELLMQRIDDEARRRMGWRVPLRGTGMALQARLLADLAPRLHTLAEDLELDVLLAARRATVRFVPEAIVRDPKPTEARGVSNQRARWFQGQIQVLRDYWSEFLKALVRGGFGTWMLLPLLFLRPKLLMMATRVVALVVGIIVGAPWWIVGLALLADLLYYLCGAAVVDHPGRYLLDLASAPRYALLWAYGLIVAAVKRGKWLRAGR